MIYVEGLIFKQIHKTYFLGGDWCCELFMDWSELTYAWYWFWWIIIIDTVDWSIVMLTWFGAGTLFKEQACMVSLMINACWPSRCHISLTNCSGEEIGIPQWPEVNVLDTKVRGIKSPQEGRLPLSLDSEQWCSRNHNTVDDESRRGLVFRILCYLHRKPSHDHPPHISLLPTTPPPPFDRCSPREASSGWRDVENGVLGRESDSPCIMNPLGARRSEGDGRGWCGVWNCSHILCPICFSVKY